MSNCLDNKPGPTPFTSGLDALSHPITIDEAATMVGNFEASCDSMLAPSHQGSGTLPLYETFKLQDIHDILTQPKTIGFRIYLGMDAAQKVKVILVGVDDDGKDVVQRYKEDPAGTYTANECSVMVMEQGQRWP